MSIKLIILSEAASFPWGMAATSRVRNLGKALLSQGLKVKYIGVRGAVCQIIKTEAYPYKGSEQGIDFIYPGGCPVRSRSWWGRRVDDVMSFWGCLIYLTILSILGKIDIILLYSRNARFCNFWLTFFRFFKIPVVIEVCEWPLALTEMKIHSVKEAKKYCECVVPRADAVLPISTYISDEIEKINEKYGRHVPQFKLPILTDFKIDEEEMANLKRASEYILYCGSLSYLDIAEFVVDVVAELKKAGRTILLYVTGLQSGANFEKLKKYIEQQGVVENVRFTGYVEEADLHKLMKEAVCLLAPLPENSQSISRFPTKLAHYLISSTPVVTNDVGEVGRYLEDGQNAFVASSYDSSLFVEKILYILDHQDKSSDVGAMGAQTAEKNFHYTCACRGLGEFFADIIKRKNMIFKN